MIKAENITKIFKTGQIEFKALQNINLSIEEGEFLIVSGRSGSGKSTLLYQLSLLDNPTSGKIIFDNKDISLLSNREKTLIRLEKLGYVFQDYALLPELTALENIILPLLMMGVNSRKAYKKVEETLAKFGLENKINNLPSQLSGGEQQRVSIARAIVNNPHIIFADEPTANLDLENTKDVIEILKKLNEEGQTIVMVSHEEDCFDCSSRIIKLSDGQIVS
jgi:putative ABC transport system ATP-binding protein